MKERYEDALERIRLIPAEKATAECFRCFFSETAEYLLTMDHWYRHFAEEDILCTGDTAGLREMNAALYGPLLPGGRIAALLSPAAFVTPDAAGYPAQQGKTLAAILSALLRELTALVPSVYEKRESRITAALELFIQIYCLFEGAENGLPREKSVHDAFYSYFYDYSEEMQEEVLREYFDPGVGYLQRLLLTADFSSADDLYRSGEYVSPEVLRRFEASCRLSASELDSQLQRWRQLFAGEDGEAQSVALGNPYVLLWGTPGRERLYRAFARSLRAEGIGITMPRASRGILMAVPERRPAYYESPNPRMDWVHDYDISLLMGDRLTSRLLEERRQLLAALSREGNVCVGVVQDTHEPMDSADEVKTDVVRLRFTEHQDTVYRKYQQTAEALTRAALMGNKTAEGAEHETTLS